MSNDLLTNNRAEKKTPDAADLPGQGEQPCVDPLADPTRCPECSAPVPELYRTQAHYVCRGCGQWQLDTGRSLFRSPGRWGLRPNLSSYTRPAGKHEHRTSTAAVASRTRPKPMKRDHLRRWCNSSPYVKPAQS
jgi:hypothetical protein